MGGQPQIVIQEIYDCSRATRVIQSAIEDYETLRSALAGT